MQEDGQEGAEQEWPECAWDVVGGGMTTLDGPMRAAAALTYVQGFL